MADMITKLMPSFLELSADITAFTLFELKSTGQAEEFLSTVLRVVGVESVTELLDTYGKVAQRASSAREREEGLRRDIFGHEKLGPIARNIVKLWFVGIWYQLPSAWSQTYGPRPGDQTHMVSANAYVQGLLWPAIGAHPPGAKAPGYASWTGPPEIPEIPSR